MFATATLHESGTTQPVLLISLKGRFDISSYNDFSTAYKDRVSIYEKIIIDMAELETFDSSGLGMLLMLREWASNIQTRIEVHNCPPTIAKILVAAKFDKLFYIVPVI